MPKKVPPSVVQDYPRIGEGKSAGFLDDTKLAPHPEPRAITLEMLSSFIRDAIADAEDKSSRSPLDMPEGLTPEQEAKFYADEGRKLFEYFHDYPSDPAATSHEYYLKNYRDVGTELFRDRSLQKGRMNSG